jgi:hypothetical protein
VLQGVGESGFEGSGGQGPGRFDSVDPGAHALNVPQEGVLRDLEAADGLHEQGLLAAEVSDYEGVVHVRLGGYRPD